MSPCNRLVLETLGSRPIMAKHLPKHSSSALLMQTPINLQWSHSPRYRKTGTHSRWCVNKDPMLLFILLYYI
jgi:hypothetical protein